MFITIISKKILSSRRGFKVALQCDEPAAFLSGYEGPQRRLLRSSAVSLNKLGSRVATLQSSWCLNLSLPVISSFISNRRKTVLASFRNVKTDRHRANKTLYCPSLWCRTYNSGSCIFELEGSAIDPFQNCATSIHSSSHQEKKKVLRNVHLLREVYSACTIRLSREKPYTSCLEHTRLDKTAYAHWRP